MCFAQQLTIIFRKDFHMAVQLHVSLDLGGDSLKIAYAYQDSYKKIKYGKLNATDSVISVAYPALACYDDENKCWIFGEEVDLYSDRSFEKIVKIKELMSLLSKKGTDKYYLDHHFPKFYFPQRINIFDDFAKSIADQKTFTDPKNTPKSVCQNFFAHVKNMVDKRVAKLSINDGVEFSPKYNIAIVHPPKSTKEYIAELESLIKNAFGTVPSKILSSTKALGMYAKHRGVIKRDDNMLIFDMGEESISVNKITLTKSDTLVVDGVEGHVAPLDLGGINIDYAIADYVESDMHNRDAVGAPGSASNDKLHEDALVSKQYLFMKSVKKAKTVLSKEHDINSVFRTGAPIGIYYEVYVQKIFTHQNLRDCIGTSNNTGIAKQISDYILKELSMPLNRGLTSKKEFSENGLSQHGYVVLSGGLSETHSLKEYIEKSIHNSFPNVDVITFDDKRKTNDGFTILSHEDSAYAPSVGGAIVALNNDDIHTVLSLSYGTWVNCDNTRCLDIFVDRGRVLSKKNAFTIEYAFSGTVVGERLYSTIVTHTDINAGSIGSKRLDIKTDRSGKKYLRIGEETGDPYRKGIKDVIQLQTVAGGDNATIAAYYKGHEVEAIYDERGIDKSSITVTQGIAVDDEGRIACTYGVFEPKKSQRIRIRCKEYKYTPSTAITAGELKIVGPNIIVVAEQND